VDATKDIVVSMIITLIRSFLDLDTDTLKTMFIEYVQNHEVFDTLYVIDDDFIAYEEVVKNYKDGLYR